jgi:hypothetical protein
LDLLLRRLARLCPSSIIRAFADDTAIVIDDFFKHARLIRTIFQDFGAISGMELNIPKTVIVRLWPQDLCALQDTNASELPEWVSVEVTTASTYLGYTAGPGKGDSSWQKANQKFRDRVGLWGSQHLGLQYAALTYNVYAVSVLAYVAQLEEPPDSTYSIEAWGLTKSAVGPSPNWASAEDFWNLSRCYGQARSFHSVSVMAWASKIRVATFQRIRRPNAV